MLRFRRAFAARAYAQAERDVLENREVVEQRVVLKDEPHASALRRLTGGVDPVEVDGTLIGMLEAGDDAQQRGLARAGRSEQPHELPGLHRQVDAVECLVAAKPMTDAPGFDAHTCSRSTPAGDRADSRPPFDNRSGDERQERDGRQQ